MLLADILSTIIQLITLKPKTHYQNNERTEKIYFHVYRPIFEKLLSYSLKYEETDNLAEALLECRQILLKHKDVVNCTLIDRIDKIVNPDKSYNQFPYFFAPKKTNAKKEKKTRENHFDRLFHEIIHECNLLCQAIGLPLINLTQKSIYDKWFYNSIYLIFEILITILLYISIPLSFIVIIGTIMIRIFS